MMIMIIGVPFRTGPTLVAPGAMALAVSITIIKVIVTDIVTRISDVVALVVDVVRLVRSPLVVVIESHLRR